MINPQVKGKQEQRRHFLSCHTEAAPGRNIVSNVSTRHLQVLLLEVLWASHGTCNSIPENGAWDFRRGCKQSSFISPQQREAGRGRWGRRVSRWEKGRQERLPGQAAGGNLTSLRWTAKKPSFCELMETLVTSTRGTSDLICPDFWSARRRLLFVKRKIRDVLWDKTQKHVRTKDPKHSKMAPTCKPNSSHFQQ